MREETEDETHKRRGKILGGARDSGFASAVGRPEDRVLPQARSGTVAPWLCGKYPNEVTVAVVFSDDEDESIGYARCTGKPVTKLGDLAMFEEPGEEFALGGFKVPIGWHPDTLIACLGLQQCEANEARICFSYGIEVASYVYAK